MDPACTELYEEAKAQGKEGYLFWKTGEFKTTDEMIDYYAELCDKYPIISLEDGLAEDDWEGWVKLNERIATASNSSATTCSSRTQNVWRADSTRMPPTPS